MSPAEGVLRVFLVVLDSVGVGELPDAADWGDEGSNTLVNLADATQLALPSLQSLGLGCIVPVRGVPPASGPLASWGKMAERSKGKDTTTGHWEMVGIILERAFPTYPRGFPPEVMDVFEQRIGRGSLGNKTASGTAIIDELGGEHMATGNPIIYTSADSVFQIAAHEEVIPIEELYRICRDARDLLAGEHAVGRVIARPFLGSPGSFERTKRRRDFSLPPPHPHLLNLLVEAGVPTVGVGKLSDIFAGEGFTESQPGKGNEESVERLYELADGLDRGFVFANLVDFDMLYGHRNDTEGYAAALTRFDAALPRLITGMGQSDVLLITADHGCDPTTASTDHSREYVPVLAYRPGVTGTALGTRSSFSDVGKTVAELFSVGAEQLPGESFAAHLGV